MESSFTNITLMPSTNFTFDGKSSEDFGLRIYFIEENAITEKPLWNSLIVEDRLPNRIDPLFYNIDSNHGLQHTVVIGGFRYLTAEEVDAVAHWLTSPLSYKWLSFDRPDLQKYQYRAIITDLAQISINDLPVAFRVTITTDCQYAYEVGHVFHFNVDDGEIINDIDTNLFNPSSYNGYIYPRIRMVLPDKFNNFTIINEHDSGREFSFSEFPLKTATIASVFGELWDKYMDAKAIYNDLKSVLDDIDAFIGQYPVDPTLFSNEDMIGKYPFNSDVIDGLKKMTLGELKEMLEYEENNIKTTYIYEHFAVKEPQSYDSLIEKDDRDYVVHISGEHDEVFNFYPSVDAPEFIASIYNYAIIRENNVLINPSYELFPLIRYLCCLENDINAPVNEGVNEYYESLAKIHLLRAMIDYVPQKELTDNAQEKMDAAWALVAPYSCCKDYYSQYGTPFMVDFDNKNQIIKCSNVEVNCYEYFGNDYGDRNFFRLCRGDNKLQFRGTAEVYIEVYFLRKVGW